MFENDVINLEEATEYLKFKSTQTVRAMCKRKEIPFIFIGGEYRFSRIALSMHVAGYNVSEIYEKIAENMLKKSAELLV